MVASQPAIVADTAPFALFVLFNVTGNASVVAQQCGKLHALVDELNLNQPGAHLNAAVSFSASFCKTLNIETPLNFTAFEPLGEGTAFAPATQCDMLLHVHSTRVDLNFFLLRKWMSAMASQLSIVDETYGYRYLDSRDMTGFIDGTENPQDEDTRRDVSIIAEGHCAGGSVVMLQRYVHQLDAWEPMSVAQQEQIIGRTKSDSVELEDVPETSHVGRVDIKENGKGLKIVRHSLPYGGVSKEHGLLFLAYSHSQRVHQTLLESMFGERDGKTDMLLTFTHAVTGAYFFAPSMKTLNALS